MVTAYIGLGSNLGDRETAIRGAAAELGAARLSTIRETEPWGPVADQPLYLNAVAELETELPPRTLLERLLAVEQRHGRVRGNVRFGPRTLDLDLLLYGSQQLAEPDLTVPHPRLRERRFVLEPLAELAPDLHVPGLGPVHELLLGVESDP